MNTNQLIAEFCLEENAYHCDTIDQLRELTAGAIDFDNNEEVALFSQIDWDQVARTLDL